MIIIFLGPPGAGKGTYSGLLAEALKIPHISTGDLLRESIAKESPFGRMAKEFIERGELVPTDLMMSLLGERITRFDAHKGFVLDGFPRTVVQAKKLDELLEVLLRKISHIYDLHLPDKEIIERLTRRRVCSNCGAIYHIKRNPPKENGVCDICGGEVVQRADDTEDVIRHRIDVYRKNVKPLLGYYKGREEYKVINALIDSSVSASQLLKILSLEMKEEHGDHYKK